MLKLIKKIFSPPGPVELGRSERNALPLRRITPFINDYSWEDWRAEVKEKYPVRYFLSETLTLYLAVKIVMPLRHLKWKIIDFFKRPHMLDLRSNEYKGGYIDPREAMLQANFVLLTKWIESNPYNPRNDYSEKEIDELHMREQQNHYDEARALYNYWVLERKELEEDSYRLHRLMDKAVEANDKKEYELLKEKWHESYDEIERREEEALERLIKIRTGLW